MSSEKNDFFYQAISAFYWRIQFKKGIWLIKKSSNYRQIKEIQCFQFFFG